MRKIINDYIGLLPLGALFGVVALVATMEIKDLDLWLHLGLGKFIMTHRYVPDVDILSCTIAGKPWVNHEWLFQILIYNIFERWGADGLLKMQAGVVVVTMLLLWFLGNHKDKHISTTIMLVMVFMIYQQRFTLRPDIFSLLFFTLYIFILALHIDKKWSTVALFIIQVLWSNVHGYFFFGPLFVLIGLASEWIKRHVPLPYEWNTSGRLTDDEYKRLKMIFVWVVLACLVNPGFIAGAVYPMKVFFTLGGENKIFFKYIQELQKPITKATFLKGVPDNYFELIIFISFVSFILNRRKIDISALFFWIVFLIFSLQAIRNTSYFAFAAYLVFITNTISLSYKDIIPIRFTQEKFLEITSIMLKILILIWICRYGYEIGPRGYYDLDKYERKSEYGGISLLRFPIQAVDFLVEHKIQGNFFNDFNSGAYLVGRCFPDIKVFIDGRTEVYGGKFFDQYAKMWEHGDPDLLDEAVEKYKLTGALLNSVRSHIPVPVLKYFYNKKDWRVVYFDYDAVIFLKDVPENRDHIARLAMDLTQWEPQSLDRKRIGSENVLPYFNYYRAYALDSLGLEEQALAEAQEALKVAPSYPEVNNLIGKIYASRKEYEKAFEYFRLATTYSPNNREFQENLAQSYFDMGDYAYAIKAFKNVMARWPAQPKAYFFLSHSYVKTQAYDNAVEALQKAIFVSPDAVKDILRIGDSIYEQNNFAYALNVYQMGLKASKNQDETHQKIAEAYIALGEKDQAKDHLQKALSVNPENKEVQKMLEELEK